MHPKVSKAEFDVFKALSAAGLTGGMVTQQPIVLKATIPDFLWVEKRKAVYLDGDVVHKDGAEWDEEVVNLLEKEGWQVLRIRYHAPLTGTDLASIVVSIADFIGAELKEQS
jgi:very-short-patch-repair endonuclease